MDQTTQIKKSKDRPIFIFGNPRSGTSLMSKLLNSHPRIAIPFESHIYNTFYRWLRYYGDLKNSSNRERLVDDIFSTDPIADWYPYPDRKETLKAIKKHDFHGVFEAIMLAWTQRQGKQRWGEKTPTHIFYSEEILSGFPDLQVIHIVRDGRDCALSWRKSRVGPKNIYSAAQGWIKHLEAIEALKAKLDPSSFLEVRYEKLLSNTPEILQNICSFLKEDYSPEMLKFYKDGGSYRTDKQNLKNLKQPIISSNSEKWRTEMTENELRIFEAIAGHKLEDYGYSRELKSSKISVFDKLKFRYIEHPPLKFLSMVKNRKGQIQKLQELKIYWNLRLGFKSPKSLYKYSLIRNP